MLDDAGLKEVFLLLEVHGFTHPWKWIFSLGEDRAEADLGAATVGDELHVLFAECGAEAEEAVGHGVAAVGGFEFGGGAQHAANLFLKLVAPESGVLRLDLVDDVDAKVEVDALVSQDVLV